MWTAYDLAAYLDVVISVTGKLISKLIFLLKGDTEEILRNASNGEWIKPDPEPKFCLFRVFGICIRPREVTEFKSVGAEISRWTIPRFFPGGPVFYHLLGGTVFCGTFF